MKVTRFWLMKQWRNVCVALLGTMLAALAMAQNAITAVTGNVQGGAEIVRIDLSEALSAAPSGFVIQSPARIALDFPGVSNGLGRSTVDVNQGNLKSVNVVQAGDRTRVVLNLKQATPYQTEVKGKSLYISLTPVSNSTVAPQQPPAFAENLNSDVLPLKDVDFRRAADGAGRVIIGLANNQVGVDLRKQGKGLTIDFLKTSLPEGLRRRLDVTDFGTPVQLVTTVQQGDRVRMTIDVAGDWEHSAYQADNQFVVEIRQQKKDLSKLTPGPGYTGERLSLNFQNIEVRSLLQVIADFTNFNIVTSDTVTGSLTLRLKDVPWDQALQIIMDAKGLGMRKSGTVLWIAPKDEIDARMKKDLQAADEIRKLEPLKTQAFQLNYAKANDIVNQLTNSNTGGTGNNTRFLTERGNVIAEPRTNQIFVTDTSNKLEDVRQLLLSLDVPVRQVLIEARIVEARDSFGRALGARLGFVDNSKATGDQPGYSFGGSNRAVVGTSYTNAVGSVTGAGINTGGSFVNLPASLPNVNNAASFALSIFNSAANRFLTLELSAMEADGNGRIVSSPRLITADQTKALIEQGTDIPYSMTAPNGATSVAFKKAVLKLEVTPQITPEGNIILDLDVNKDSPGQLTPQGVAIDTKHVKTQVLVENGGTVVIGGIFTLDESDQVNKVPLLGDIPVMGNLFKNRTKQSTKQEMLVFITPKIIQDRGGNK